MIKAIKSLFVTLFLFAAVNTTAQWSFDQLSGSDGLSQNTIKSILQDSNGFIWIGTYNGINKYDGYSMQHYYYSNNENGLSSNLIHSLFEDKDGFIWAGTSDAGINRINPKTGEIKKYFDSPETSGYFRNVEHIYQTESGVFFYPYKTKLKLFKISDSGELIFDKTVSSIDGVEFNFRFLVATNKQSYWLLSPLSKTKLWKLNISDDGNEITVDETNFNTIFFKEGYVETFYESPKNTFWFVSNKLELRKIKIDNQLNVVENKLIQLLPNLPKKENVNFVNIVITADQNKRLWIAGNKFLLNYNTATGEITDLRNNRNYGINHMQFLNLMVDDSNLLWLGTLYNGLYKIDLDNNAFHNSSDFLKLSEKNYRWFHKYPIMAMSQDNDGNLWFGTQGPGGLAMIKEDEIEKGITTISKKTWEFNYLPDNPNFKNFKFDNIRRIFLDSKNNIWIGSRSGLSKIYKSPTTKKYDFEKIEMIKNTQGQIIEVPIFSIEEDKDQNLWVGFWGSGLVKMTFDKQSKSYKTSNYTFKENELNTISNNFVRDILEDSDGNLWVGTVVGLNKIENTSDENPKFKRYFNQPDDNNSLSNNHILDLFQAKNGKLYVGTLGGGLNEITIATNGKLSFKHYVIEDGLPSNVVYQISEDEEGNIWMLHIREISKLNPVTGNITYFDREDGFEIDEFKDNAMLMTQSGTLLCGGVNGFTFFKPNEITVNSHPPILNIVDFKLFEESIKPNVKIKGNVILKESINETKKIELPYNLNSIEFVFSSIHFSNPAKNQYRFKLEGFEDKWQTSKGNERRFASYTNVPPGTYTFKVYGSNSAGVWVKQPKEITVIINSPWYFTPLAISLFSILLFIVIVIIVKVRSNQIRLEGRLKLESALHEKSDEINKMKLQFFTNISHELRTPLTLIIGPLQQIMQGNADPTYLKKLNSIMYKNSLRLLKLINQLLDFRKAESGNLKLVVQEGDLVNFVQEIYNSFEEIALEKEIKFVFISPKNNIDAWFDRDKIEKILYNLLSNAFKFTPKGKSIKLTVDVVVENGISTAKIEVIDYGIGIPEDELQSVFERFYQTKKENNSIHIGSGLGLAYTQKLVKIHNGNIDITSTLHKGTTCVILIPLERASYVADDILENQINQHDFRFTKNEISDIKELSNNQSYPEEKQEHTKETKSILIVEDNIELQNYLFNYFNANYKVLTANNGKEGLEQAKKELPNIIISDLMMPIMDGIEMCKKIKTDIQTSHIPVVILTAKSGLENEKEGLETGADEFVLKPFNIEILKLRIENILRTKQQWIQKFGLTTNSKSIASLSNKLDQEFLDKCVKIIKKNLDNPQLSVESFSSDIAMSRSALFKKLKSITGQSTSEFIRTIRLKRAAKYLRSGKYTITEVIFMVGFSDPKYFRTCFKKQFEVNPSEYLKSLK